MEEHFLCKVEEGLGGGPEDLREAKLPDRIIRWAQGGLRYTADLRRAEQLPRGLLARCDGVKQVSFPGFKREIASPTGVELPGVAEACQCCALAARANYLSLGRPGLGYAAKECCRRMLAPRERGLGCPQTAHS
eukprot:3788209-Alexandrium_andersonii.AAC.1